MMYHAYVIIEQPLYSLLRSCWVYVNHIERANESISVRTTPTSPTATTEWSLMGHSKLFLEVFGIYLLIEQCLNSSPNGTL